MPVKYDMTIDETIEYLEKIAKHQLECAEKLDELGCDSTSTRSMVDYYKQLAEWLRELKEQRKIQDILLQFLVDGESDICCDELAESEEEWEICGENCNNHTKDCWIRWAKMKAREVNADEDR